MRRHYRPLTRPLNKHEQPAHGASRRLPCAVPSAAVTSHDAYRDHRGQILAGDLHQTRAVTRDRHRGPHAGHPDALPDARDYRQIEA